MPSGRLHIVQEYPRPPLGAICIAFCGCPARRVPPPSIEVEFALKAQGAWPGRGHWEWYAPMNTECAAGSLSCFFSFPERKVGIGYLDNFSRLTYDPLASDLMESFGS